MPQAPATPRARETLGSAAPAPWIWSLTGRVVSPERGGEANGAGETSFKALKLHETGIPPRHGDLNHDQVTLFWLVCIDRQLQTNHPRRSLRATMEATERPSAFWCTCTC